MGNLDSMLYNLKRGYIPGLAHQYGPLSVDYMGKIAATNRRKSYFVDSVNGADTRNGSSWAKSFATIGAAVAEAIAGDTIFIHGSFSEAVTLAYQGISIIGVGNGPYGARWTGAADAKCCSITAADCMIANIRFQPPAYSAGIPCAIYLAGGTYAQILRNRFQGKTASWYAIYTTGDCDNTIIAENQFLYMNTATYGTAIKSSGAADISGMEILNNHFESNLNHIVAPMKQSKIIGNILPAGGLAAAGTYSATLTVLGIDVHGAASGYNVVTQNQLGSLYHQACYYAGTGDEWNGNYCKDRSHATQVDATTGLSILAPAA
jgi:hypothetical protein